MPREDLPKVWLEAVGGRVRYRGRVLRLVNFSWSPGRPHHKRATLIDPVTFRFLQDVTRAHLDDLEPI